MNVFSKPIAFCIFIFAFLNTQVWAQTRTSPISLAEVMANIEHFYVDDINSDKLNHIAVEAMLKQLDPHSDYLDEQELEELFNVTNGRYTGLGIEVEQHKEHIVIVSAIENSPAFSAGLTKGDILLTVNGTSVINQPINQVSKLINQEKNLQVELTIARNGYSDPLYFELERQKIDLKSVKGNINDQGIAYIRIVSFNNQTFYEIVKELAQFTQLANDNISGLIIDLRDNPGGVLDSAVEVSDLFLNSGVIVTTKGRFNAANQQYSAQQGDILEGAPIVVLINESSASAAEILAGALQDNQRAQLVGARSFGKGSVQSLIPIGDGQTALKLTTAKYYTPSGRSIDGKGIQPDFPIVQNKQDISLSSKLANDSAVFINMDRQDLQLEKAWQLLEK